MQKSLERIWDINFRQNHEFNIERDMLLYIFLLADTFENFQNRCIKTYKLEI